MILVLNRTKGDIMLLNLIDSIAAMKKLYTISLEPVCKKYNLTKMQLDILLFLANNPKYDTATEIVEQRQLTKSHVSTSIKSLTEKKYLQSAYLPDNKKTVHLKLSSTTNKIIKDGHEAQKNFIKMIFRDFTNEEKHNMANNFSKILNNIHQILKEEQ